MRRPEYLSHSALQLWMQDKEQYYLKYLAENRPPKFPQNEPMSVGSAFDAYAKSEIYDAIIGSPSGTAFEFETIFEKQVEEQNRDFARAAGRNCFEQYQDSGAMDSLLALLRKSPQEPQMEFTSQLDVKHGNVANDVGGGVIILGKPDLLFWTEQLTKIVLDWKVNGYCAKAGHSPVKGYKRLRAGWNERYGKYPRNHGMSHADYMPWMEEGFEINSIPHLENDKPEWAAQLATYGWLTGSEVGEKTIVAVDQLACKPGRSFPLIQVAEHRCEISPEFQQRIYGQYQECWQTIHTDWIFRDKSEEESKKRQEMLDGQARAFEGDEEKDQWFREMMGRG